MKDEIVLHIGGKEMTFSEKELAMAVEYYFAKEYGTSPESDIPGYRKPMLIPASPIEGKWFMVNPKSIDRKLFEEEREDNLQERLRKLILQIFKSVDENPNICAHPFEILIPSEKQLPSLMWAETEKKTIREFSQLLKSYNSSYSWATTTEQFLVWAQQIQNGETWEDLCNNQDTITRHRLITDKDKEKIYTIGGASTGERVNSAIYSFRSTCIPGFKISGAVPMIVRRSTNK